MCTVFRSFGLLIIGIIVRDLDTFFLPMCRYDWTPVLYGGSRLLPFPTFLQHTTSGIGYRVQSLVLSICPLHTNSGCGKRETHINWFMGDAKAASVTRTTLRVTGPVPADSRQ